MTGSVRAEIEVPGSSGGRGRAVDVDRYVSLRIRQRRIMLGLTQQQLAELIGVTDPRPGSRQMRAYEQDDHELVRRLARAFRER